MSVDSALRSMTTAPAFAAFQEKDLGALTVGRYGDFVVLSANPYTLPSEDLRTPRVLMTVVGGRVVFAAGGRAPGADQR